MLRSSQHVNVLSSSAENYRLPVMFCFFPPPLTSAGTHGIFRLSGSPIVQIVLSSSMKVAVMNSKQTEENHFHKPGSDFRSRHFNGELAPAAALLMGTMLLLMLCRVRLSAPFLSRVYNEMEKFYSDFVLLVGKRRCSKQPFISYHFCAAGHTK